MSETTSLWVYYYFLARKEGRKPVVAASWASVFCGWWLAKEEGWDVGPSPQLPK